MNSLQRRAARRARLNRIRKRAPRHPVKPEARIRLEISKLFGTYHARVKATVLHYAPRILEQRRRKLLGEFAPDPATHDAMSASIFAHLATYAKHLLVTSPFKRIVEENAKKTAESAKTQVEDALNLEEIDVDLEHLSDGLSNGIYDRTDELMAASLERADDVIEDWLDLEEPDVEQLEARLDTGLDGILGTAIQAAVLAFGYAFAQMNQETQEAAGVGEYTWVSQGDSAVRPEHKALDGETCSWDDPPLSAEESSSGEECHAGEDFNCRCIASPIDPNEEPLLN